MLPPTLTDFPLLAELDDFLSALAIAGTDFALDFVAILTVVDLVVGAAVLIGFSVGFLAALAASTDVFLDVGAAFTAVFCFSIVPVFLLLVSDFVEARLAAAAVLAGCFDFCPDLVLLIGASLRGAVLDQVRIPQAIH